VPLNGVAIELRASSFMSTAATPWVDVSLSSGCIETDTESHASIHDSWKSMSVCFAIDASAAKGGQPVSVRLA
jgi:hypothetical protein